jgi:predicted metal-binding membrane protein
MTALGMTMAAIPRRLGNFDEWLARHPEWWLFAISAVAWLIVTLRISNSFVPLICSSTPLGPIEISIAGLRASGLLSEYTGWLLMTAAMMLPLTVLQARHVAFRTFSWRRDRAIAGFVAGYLTVWAAAGTVLVPVIIVMRALDANGGRWALTFGFVLASAWQLTPLKLAALRKCHRTVALPPAGWRADIACARFGMVMGGNCVLSCWALMATPVLASHSLLAMTCTQAIAVNERYELRPRMKALALILLACAAIVFFSA